MIRREYFGGIIFHEQTHKIYTMDKYSFRLLELFFINKKTISQIQSDLLNEFGEKFDEKEIESFTKQVKGNYGNSVSVQRGRKDDGIWSSNWDRRHFSAPINCYWTFTNLCNLRCTHCAWDSDKPLPNELTTEQCKKIIDEMHTMGVCEISFSGGEPLSRKKQLLELGHYATQRGFHLGMATNATLIDTATADELLHAGINEVQVSFEGLEAHESIRGCGVWDKTINGIRVLKQKEFDITFAVAINKTNFAELDIIINTARKEGIKYIRFVRFVPIGRGKQNMSLFEFTPEEEIKLAGILWQKRWELFPETILTFNKHYVSIGVINNPQLGEIPETFGWNWDCPSARSRICIMPQGKVAPCPLIGSLGLDGGDLTQSTLSDIWNHSEFFNFIRTDKRKYNEKCESCNIWLKCKGGCKAASYAYFGNLMETDPLCLHDALKDAAEKVIK